MDVRSLDGPPARALTLTVTAVEAVLLHVTCVTRRCGRAWCAYNRTAQVTVPSKISCAYSCRYAEVARSIAAGTCSGRCPTARVWP